MAPQIGQRARLNGKDVVWSGQNYGWQSPTSHNKLEDQGKFKLGTQAIDRAIASIVNTTFSKNLVKSQQQLRNATQFLQPVEDLVNRGVSADDKLPSSRVAQGAAISANAITNRLGIDPRLAMVGMVAAGASPLRRTSPGGGVRKTPAQVKQADAPYKSPTHSFSDARLTPNVATDDWVAVGRETRSGRVVDTGAFAKLSPEDKIKARAGQLPGSPPEFHGRVYVEPKTGSAVSPKKPILATEFTPDAKARPQHNPDGTIKLDKDGVPIGGVTAYGEPKFRPATNRTPTNPVPSPGNPRPQRVDVKQQGEGVKRLERGYDIKPSDLAKPRSDGNSYGPFERVSDLPDGWQKSGNFITNNDQARRRGRDQRRQSHLDNLASQKPNQTASIREEVAWADGDNDKLSAIARRLGIKPGAYASTTQRAIERRLGKDENTYGGKPTLSQNEKAQAQSLWDWQNLRGEDLPEAKRLSELATQRNIRGGKPIGERGQQQLATPKPARDNTTGVIKDPQFPKLGQSGNTGNPTAGIPPAIQRRLDALQESRTPGGRLPSRGIRKPTEERPQWEKGTERAHNLTEQRDAEALADRTNPYQPKLSDAEREAARQARANRPLRPRNLRIPAKEPSKSQLEKLADRILKTLKGH